jgi:hypothetical protein
MSLEIFAISGIVLIIAVPVLVMMHQAKIDVQKDMEMRKYWERQDYANRVIEGCFKIESEKK